ncbi:uncharacterized protein LOC125681450 isoform X2 [Ostrea edulis]|nr:uncharacterized protein LOC125681450 isoform X2 [Ostrea edulis]XP_048777512.2 uncharacterized protein LOC125681450 isoform X2 [Ostrea edulis]
MGVQNSKDGDVENNCRPDDDNTKSKHIEEALQLDVEDSESDCDGNVEITSEMEQLAESMDPRNYIEKYPFENLVFEGGGAKGIAYPGALKALEDIGILQNIKRFAGTSVGSIVALMTALGYNSTEISQITRRDLSEYYDARWGKLSLIPNLLRYLGWQPFHSLYEHLGEIIERKLGDKDATFEQLYKKTGKELCVVVTNVNNMEENYLHPKTTPKMPLRKAVRMSISIPGLMQPIKHTEFDVENIYVDGGVLFNYPIECFDGWWLSMEKEDSFFARLQPIEKLPVILDRRNRFASDEKKSTKTLGFLLYSDDELETFKIAFESRRRTKIKYPDTPLGRKAAQNQKDRQKLRREHRATVTSVNKFLKILSEHILDKDEFIDRKELEKTLENENLTDCDKHRLFGKNVTFDEVMTKLDKDGNGKISFQELVSFIEEKGISVFHRRLGFRRQNVDTVLSLLQTLYTMLSMNIVRISASGKDLSRTVGLNTHFVETLTVGLTEEDIKFIQKDSYNTTMTFLKSFAAKMEKNT